MSTLLVIYSGDADSRFDRVYYAGKHLPLVAETWGPLGLQSANAFYPEGSGAGIVAMCVCVFRDEAALSAALAAPQTPRVMEDVEHFTAIKPMQSRLAPL